MFFNSKILKKEMGFPGGSDGKKKQNKTNKQTKKTPVMWETWVGKNCSRLLILNMKIKIAVRCHLLPTRLKKPYCVKCWKDPKDSLLNCLLKVYSFAFYIEVLIYLELLWGK